MGESDFSFFMGRSEGFPSHVIHIPTNKELLKIWSHNDIDENTLDTNSNNDK